MIKPKSTPHNLGSELALFSSKEGRRVATSKKHLHAAIRWICVGADAFTALTLWQQTPEGIPSPPMR